MAGIANLFALIDQLKRNVGRNLQDPMGAVELGLLRADEDFKADPVNTVLGNANIGGGLLGMTKMVKPPKALQADALETARRNAVEMLGLPENNTAMDRAKAMGFDTPVFHGSNRPDIEALDPKKAGEKTGNAFDDYVFSTAEPQNASGYSLNWDSFKNAYKNDPSVIAEEVRRLANNRAIADAFQRGDKAEVERLKKELTGSYNNYERVYQDFLDYKIPSEGATVYPMLTRSEEFYPYNAEGKVWKDVNRPAIDSSKNWGFPGVKIKSVRDNAGQYGGTSDVFATNKPELFRSRFAAFDPARRNEADLLASRLLPLALPGLLFAGDEEE